jgi:nanoRNase/pAp phosphatase (c-di-AMP/oligoRNAs hydrolase)
MRTRGTSHNPVKSRPQLGYPDDRGFVAAFTLAVSVALILLVGIVLDSGRYMRAQSDTFGVAAAAARAGAQNIDQTAALAGQLRLDETAAQQAALNYLTRRGFQGVVTISGLEVTVTAHRPLAFQVLPGSANVHATATARASVDRAP